MTELTTREQSAHRPLRDRWVEPAQRVEKPWGHESVFAVAEGLYVGKMLHVRAGSSLSLQRHTDKDETISLLSGSVTLEIGPSEDELDLLVLQPGDSVRVRPGVVHRLSGVEDSVVVEASTAGSGWRNDVVRLADSYGRQGTDAP